MQAKLLPKHELFVLEYCKDWNATRAAEACGYKSPTVQGSNLLNAAKYPAIHLAIEERKKITRAEAEIDTMAIVKELVKLAMINPKRMFRVDGTLLNIHEIPDAVAVCIKEFRTTTKVHTSEDGTETVTISTTEVKFWDKLDALRQLAQHLGLLKEVNNVTNINQMVISWDEMYKRQGTMGNYVDPVKERLDNEQQKLIGIKLEPASVTTLPPVSDNAYGPSGGHGANGQGGASNGNGRH